MLVNLNQDVHVYSPNNKVSGKLVTADFLSDTGIIEKNGHKFKEKLSELVKVDLVGILGGKEIHVGDVLLNTTGHFIKVSLSERGKLVGEIVNTKGDVLGKDETELSLELALSGSEYVANIEAFIELGLNKVDFDFTVQVLRSNVDNEIKYFYACNDKENERVDVMSVVFMGADILDNDYTRETFSYDGYEVLLEKGEFTVVGENELRNYAVGAVYGNRNKAVVREEEEDAGVICGVTCDCDFECDDYESDYYRQDEDEDEYEDEDFEDEEACEYCGDVDFDCDCDNW